MDMRSDDYRTVESYRVIVWRNGWRESEYADVMRVTEGPNYLSLYNADGTLTLLSAREYYRVKVIPQYDKGAMQ